MNKIINHSHLIMHQTHHHNTNITTMQTNQYKYIKITKPKHSKNQTL